MKGSWLTIESFMKVKESLRECSDFQDSSKLMKL